MGSGNRLPTLYCRRSGTFRLGACTKFRICVDTRTTSFSSATRLDCSGVLTVSCSRSRYALPVTDGKADIRFEHEQWGLEVARRVQSGLGYSEQFIERICAIIAATIPIQSPTPWRMH